MAGVPAVIRRNLLMSVKMCRDKNRRPVHWSRRRKQRGMELDERTSAHMAQRRAVMLPRRVLVRNPLESAGQQPFGDLVLIARRHQHVQVSHRTHVRRGIQPIANREALQQGRLDTEVSEHVEHGDGRRNQVGMTNSRREVGSEERPGPFRRDILAVRRRPAQQRTQPRPKDPVELSIVSHVSTPVDVRAAQRPAGSIQGLEQSRRQGQNGAVGRRDTRQRAAAHVRLEGTLSAKRALRLGMDTASIEHSDFTISREVNGEMLVLDGRAELIHQLNPTASFIWQQAQSGSTAEAIAAALAEQYDVDLETAHRDVATTLARLKELNLVTSD